MSVRKQSCNGLEKSSPAVSKCLELYGDEQEFLLRFNARSHREHCRDLAAVYQGSTPSLGLVRRAYGDNLAESWLMVMLSDVNEYSGVQHKMEPEQIEDLAMVLLDEYGYLRVAEFMLFFRRFKAGNYGRFYGAVDPGVITLGLRDFLSERLREKERIERQLRDDDARRAYNEAQEKCITYDQWLAIKKQNLETSSNGSVEKKEG